MSGVSGGHQDVDIDLGGLFRAIWRRRGRVLMATVVFAGLAFTGANLMSPQYQSETRLLIESRQPAYSGANQSTPQTTDSPFDESGISSQVQVLRSVDLIKQVAREMKLYELPEFDPTANPSAISDVLVMLGIKKNPLDLPPEERVLKEFEEKLQVYQVEKSRVIAIQFTSKDPKLAAAIPNEMAKVFQSLQSGAKLDSNSEASRWLEPEIANLREKVRDAEAKVADYRASSDLLLTGETGGTFATKQLNDISTELARVRGERANADARAEGVRTALANGRAVDTLNDVVASPMIQRLKETESNVQAQVADLSTTLLDGHPRLKALKAQLQGIRTQIVSETKKILGSLENEANVAQLREKQLIGQLNTLKASSAKAGEDEVGLRALEREAVAQRQLLETYLARYREATSRSGADAAPADARVISRAVEPTEAQFPKVVPITIVAAFASFLVSCVVIMLSELFSGRALRPVGVEHETVVEEEKQKRAAAPLREQPVPATERVAVAPQVAPADITDDDFSIQSVAEHVCGDDVRVAISVSPAGDKGSMHTVMLARLVAEQGRKIAVIDLTGSAYPTRLMAQSAGLAGITNLLVGEVPFTETIHSDRLSDAHIIPQGDADAALAMRGIERLQMIIDALTNAYDTVLVECGPADVEAIKRVYRSQDAEIIISAPSVDNEAIIDLITGFGEAGFTNIVLMTGTGYPKSGDSGRRAA
ncbi:MULTISPECIES: GumC family protein [unclassified Rhizobium]|uniref:GumC family protein n=1 Tax=unclassified Rhizobium TaxID=2613769 RepID=UPI000713300D|nr:MULTISPECIES: exopolysaccharide transport family protein [unclassified Rhizobium]KQS93916.1 chain-length determining protein [Rhizobium sp. Leaf386]KQT06567.1 chain-length determining protein [Rhizobium sp. Leaf391]KQU04996.1 chain-length determining protein [Rhizobium sp. Leaf453]